MICALNCNMITYLKLGLYSLIICFSSLSFGLQCRSLFDSYKPAYHQHTENRSHFETNFKNWLNTALSKDFTNNNLSKFRAKFRNASRWQFIRQNMTSPLKELLNLARPEFFTDQIPPSPEQLTIAMQTIYDRLQVPEVIRILPGLILFNPATKQYKPFRYAELKSQWPEGFIVPETNLSDLIILDGFNHGVMHLDWQTSIHEKFKVHMFYHDLNHLASFLEPETGQAR